MRLAAGFCWAVQLRRCADATETMLEPTSPHPPAGGHKLNKKLEVLKKKGKLSGRAANVSVEGRNVTIQH